MDLAFFKTSVCWFFIFLVEFSEKMSKVHGRLMRPAFIGRMKMQFFYDPYILLLFAIIIGQFIGRVEYNNFKLGSAATLFAGLLMSYFRFLAIKHQQMDLAESSQVIISKQLFVISLIGFIASVGLLASSNIKKALKENGYKFVVLSFVITFTGATCTYLLGTYLLPQTSASVIGTYVGALTSSPGLATALEIGKGFGVGGEALIGLGYSVAYIPGVLLVILYVQFEGRKIKVQQREETVDNIVEQAEDVYQEVPFSVAALGFVAGIGILIGRLSIDFGESIGTISLGKTGGVLLSALFFGYRQQFMGMSFNMDRMVLKGIRDISLNIFLAIVGINYGYQVILLGQSAGVALFIVGMITAALSISVGYLVGYKVLKIERVPLVGGLCGGMTSTPGLASAIEAIESDEVTVFYGATYPFALLFMIFFTNIVSKLLI